MNNFHFSIIKIKFQFLTSKLAHTVFLILIAANCFHAQISITPPPQIIEFNFSPSNIDTTNSPQNVTVDIRVKDEIRGVNAVYINFQSKTKAQTIELALSGAQRVSGNDKDGIYRAQVIFPKYSEAGKWQVQYIRVLSNSDFYYKTFNAEDLIARGFETELQVVSNNEDVTAPEVTAFSISSSIIDTSGAPSNTIITIRATDAKAGVRGINVWFQPPGINLTYHPLYLDQSNRISGDEKDGVYRIPTAFTPYGVAGNFSIFVSTVDLLGNRKMFAPSELEERGFQSQLMVNNSNRFVLVSGQIKAANGRGIPRVLITLTAPDGKVKYATTNPFGYYRFEEVRLIGIYNFQFSHKRYNFSQQNQYIGSARSDLDFIASQ